MNKEALVGLALSAALVLGGAGCPPVATNKDVAAEKNGAMMKKLANIQPENVMVKNEDADGGQETAATAELEKKEAMMKQNTTSPPEQGETMKPSEGTAQAGSYEEYDKSKLAFAKSGKVILFFKASWCPTCKSVDADIKANVNNIPKNVFILAVDYDNSEAMRRQYGVTYQHTFVEVDENGVLLKKWSGSPTLASIVSQIQ